MQRINSTSQFQHINKQQMRKRIWNTNLFDNDERDGVLWIIGVEEVFWHKWSIVAGSIAKEELKVDSCVKGIRTYSGRTNRPWLDLQAK